MNDISKFVAYIECKINDVRETHGVGVIVGHFLITAGHVVDSAEKVYATVNGKTYCLDDSNRMFFQSMGDDDYDTTHNDIAIFKINEIESPLRLSDKLPETNSKYTSIYFVEETQISDNEHIPLIFRISSTLSIEESSCIYEGDDAGYFFACKTEKILHKGNSGCPLIDGFTVYGILSAGVPGQHKCVYQSAKSVKRILDNINTKSTL